MTKTRVLVIFGFLLIFLVGWKIYAQNIEMKREIDLKERATQNQLTQPSLSPTPTIIEIDTRDPDWQQQLIKVMPDYCKFNDCSTPMPKATAREKPPTVDPNEKTHCYVEKNGSFEMTVKECQDLHDANPFGFQVKAYTNCLDGKNYAIGDSGSPESRKQACSDLMGIVEKDQ